MNSWNCIRLGDVCCVNTEAYSEKERWDYVHYLDTGNITKNCIDEIQYIDLMKEKLPSRARRKVKYNSILYSTVRPNQCHYGIVKEQSSNFLVSTGFSVIDVIDERVDADFLYCYLTMNTVTEKMHAIAEQSTSAYPAIKSSDIEDLELKLPDILTQKRIASFLMSLEHKITNNTKLNKNLEEQARTIFYRYFIHISDIPKGWQEGYLTDIAEYLNGLAMQKFRPQNEQESLPVLKIKELRQGQCDINSERCSLDIKPQYIIHDGDVIFSWSGSLLVDFWCGGICGLNQHLFKVHSKQYAPWLYYSWTKYYLAEFVAMAADKATTMGHIKRDALENARVLIPCPDDYLKIEEQLQPLYDAIIAHRVEIRKLSTLRNTLLPRLMSGEIDVSNITL